MDKDEPTLYTAKPSLNDGAIWIVYDMYEPLPPKPIFIGTMEEAGLVADAKNRPIVAKLSGSPHP